MRQVLSYFLLLAAFAGLSLPEAGRAQEMTVVERLVAEQNPCRDLRTTELGFDVGIDVLESVNLDSAEITLVGDEVSVSLTGRLSCRTSDDAFIEGSASARIGATARLSLAECSIAALDVALGEFGGEFGPIFAALSPLLEDALSEAARGSLADACQDFRGA